MLLIALLSLQAVATLPAFGVATKERSGEICLAMEGPILSSGAPVTLLQPELPQRSLAATIRETRSRCPALEQAMIGGPYYILSVARLAPLESTSFIAMAGTPTLRRLPQQRLSMRVSSRYANLQIRSCASNEGVHLTVWAGTPLRSRKLWHAYYYVPFDLEPSCDARDARD